MNSGVWIALAIISTFSVEIALVRAYGEVSLRDLSQVQTIHS